MEVLGRSRLSACECVYFHPCEDLRNFEERSPSYGPLYSHHFFGVKEEITGFKKLELHIFYTPITFHTCFIAEGVKREAISPTSSLSDYPSFASVLQPLLESSAEGQCLSVSDFLAEVHTQHHVALPGKRVKTGNLEGGQFHIHQCSFHQDDETNHKPYHQSPIRFNQHKSTQNIHTKSPKNHHKISQRISVKISHKNQKILEQISEKHEKISKKISDTNQKNSEKISTKNERNSEKISEKKQQINPQKQLNFESLHRRVEWFLHWFIESASRIYPDRRWRIYLPYVGLAPRRKRVRNSILDTSLNGQDGLAPGSSYKGGGKRGGKSGAKWEKTTGAHLQHNVQGNLQTNQAISNFADIAQTDMQNNIREMHKNIGNSEKTIGNSKENIGNSEKNIESSENIIGNSEKNIGNGEKNIGNREKSVVNTPKNLKMMEECEIEKSELPMYHLAGLATTYNFFTMNGERKRISQFLIFPHLQSKGLGTRLLQHIFEEALDSPCVREITVEDPALSFYHLRDIVCLKVAIERDVVPVCMLYPAQLRNESIPHSAHIFAIEYNCRGKIALTQQKNQILTLPKSYLKAQLKETLTQTNRVLETLHLAQLLVLDAEESTALHCRAWREGGSNPTGGAFSPRHKDDFSGSENLRNYRIAVKRRIKRQNIEHLNDSTISQIKGELEREWQAIYTVYTRTIRKLRSVFPLPS